MNDFANALTGPGYDLIGLETMVRAKKWPGKKQRQKTNV